jgi:hypothetical protein
VVWKVLWNADDIVGTRMTRMLTRIKRIFFLKLEIRNQKSEIRSFMGTRMRRPSTPLGMTADKTDYFSPQISQMNTDLVMKLKIRVNPHHPR